MPAYVMPEFRDLDAYRLEKDWSWTDLAKAMKAANYPVSMRQLHFLCTDATDDHRPRDRTIYKIRRFLDHLRSYDREVLNTARRRSVEPPEKATRARAGAAR